VSKPRSHLAVVNDRSALAWIARESCLAFPSTRRREALTIAPGDEIFLYVTRGAYHNPTRDRAQICAAFLAHRSAEALAAPILIAGREFLFLLPVVAQVVAAPRRGADFASMAESMEFIPAGCSWAPFLRRAIFLVPSHDAAVLRRELSRAARIAPGELSDYSSLGRA
jgi:hypothetical protein